MIKASYIIVILLNDAHGLLLILYLMLAEILKVHMEEPVNCCI